MKKYINKLGILTMVSTIIIGTNISTTSASEVSIDNDYKMITISTDNNKSLKENIKNQILEIKQISNNNILNKEKINIVKRGMANVKDVSTLGVNIKDMKNDILNDNEKIKTMYENKEHLDKLRNKIHLQYLEDSGLKLELNYLSTFKSQIHNVDKAVDVNLEEMYIELLSKEHSVISVKDKSNELYNTEPNIHIVVNAMEYLKKSIDKTKEDSDDVLQRFEELHKEYKIRQEEEYIRKEKEKKDKQEKELQNSITTTYNIPTGDTSNKTFMSYRSITNRSSAQYKLQHDGISYTDEYGLRRRGQDYMIALGSYYGTNIGDRYKITFESGTVITATLGDQKSDKHTDANNQKHSIDGSVIEFITDSNSKLNSKMKEMGDISYHPSINLQGNVKSIQKIK